MSCGIVLAVAVERDDDLAARRVEAGRQRGGLAEVAVEIDDAQVADREPAMASSRASVPVAAAVVDEHELVGQPDPCGHLR